MISRIEALNYRTLRYISQTLTPFQVLIGPNASGKSTFLDVVAFMADIINERSAADAVRLRAPDLRDLTWMRQSDWLELALEVQIPSNLASTYTHLRYEMRLGVDSASAEIALPAETLWLMTAAQPAPPRPVEQPELFPAPPQLPERITSAPNRRTPSGWRKVISKTDTGNDYFRAETTDWNNMFRLGPQRPALANLPEDETRFAVAIWFKRYLAEGVQRIQLNSEALRRPSPPQSPRKTFLPDGANLPWIIHELTQHQPDSLREWIAHVQTALPNIRNITTVARDEDNHRYLVVEYDTGLRAPAWLVSDGTLRMLALTLLGYLPNLNGIYLIEEPENGIHPRAVETVYQALSSVYEAQVFLATHSPVVLNMAVRDQLLCFDRTPAGETDIVLGSQHPSLATWQNEVSLSTLFAAGVLG